MKFISLSLCELLCLTRDMQDVNTSRSSESDRASHGEEKRNFHFIHFYELILVSFLDSLRCSKNVSLRGETFLLFRVTFCYRVKDFVVTRRNFAVMRYGIFRGGERALFDGIILLLKC